MSDEEIKLPSVEELAKLPLRAIVIYAARNARRVMPLYRLPDSVRPEERVRHSRAVQSAVIFAEDFGHGYSIGAAARAGAVNARAVATRAAAAAAARAATYAADAADAIHTYDSARAARAAAATAAASAATYAVFAAKADAPRASAFADFRTLLSLEPEALNQGIDPSESGPLGPLWPSGPPDWYLPSLRRFEALVADEPQQKFLFPPKQSTQKQEPEEQSVDFVGQPMKVYVDAGGADEETIRDLYLALSAVYESRGGSGLQVVKHSQGTLVCDEVPV